MTCRVMKWSQMNCIVMKWSHTYVYAMEFMLRRAILKRQQLEKLLLLPLERIKTVTRDNYHSISTQLAAAMVGDNSFNSLECLIKGPRSSLGTNKELPRTRRKLLDPHPHIHSLSPEKEIWGEKCLCKGYASKNQIRGVPCHLH